MLKAEQKFYSPEDYFELENEAEYRSEYFRGEIFAMAGGTPNHNRLMLNFANLLNTAFKGRSCEAFASDLRVQIDKEKHYTYPDVTAICGEIVFAENRKDTVCNPVLIAEILSDSTKDYDRGSKFTAYRNIESLRDYVLIEQNRVHIEHFSKENDGTWRLREYFNSEDMLILESLGVGVPICEIYSRVSFTRFFKSFQ